MLSSNTKRVSSGRNVRTISKRCRVPLLVGRVSAARSRTMSSIRAKDTKSEIALRNALRSIGLRFGVHRAGLPGKPDITFPHDRLAVFCDGDFWHGRDWCARKARGFRVRSAYWTRKIESNMARDRKINRQLRKLGWSVMRVWETKILRDPHAAATRVQRRLDRLRKLRA